MSVRAEGNPAGPPIVLLATEGALVGAVAGMLVIHRVALDTFGLVVSVLVAVAAGTALAVLLAGRGGRPPQRATVPPPVRRQVGGTPPRLVLGTGVAAEGGQWWDRQPVRHARPAAPAAGATAAPELAGYVDSAQVVQCPRCGAFRIDVNQVAGVFAFRCRVDDHRWDWRPGTGWPATVVLSRRRPERD